MFLQCLDSIQRYRALWATFIGNSRLINHYRSVLKTLITLICALLIKYPKEALCNISLTFIFFNISFLTYCFLSLALVKYNKVLALSIDINVNSLLHEFSTEHQWPVFNFSQTKSKATSNNMKCSRSEIEESFIDIVSWLVNIELTAAAVGSLKLRLLNSHSRALLVAEIIM